MANGCLQRCVYAMCFCACQLSLLVPNWQLSNAAYRQSICIYISLFHALYLPFAICSVTSNLFACIYAELQTPVFPYINPVLLPCAAFLHHHWWSSSSFCSFSLSFFFSCIECTFSRPSPETKWFTKRTFLAQFALFTRIHLWAR